MKTTLNKTRKTTKAAMKRKAWAQFSLYIRLSHCEQGELVRCYTCGVLKPYKEMQAGHWITGHNNMTYINEAYVRPQCYHCNITKGGEQGIFWERMKKEIGEEMFDFYRAEANKTVKLTLQDYTDLYHHYKSLVEGLK